MINQKHNVTELSDEELMELTGGQSFADVASHFDLISIFPLVAYGVIASGIGALSLTSRYRLSKT